MNTTPQSTLIAPPFVPFVPVPTFCGEKACAELSPVAFKVYYYIVRMTRGWKQRTEAPISYEQFKRACGIKASTTISRALKELVSKGFIAIFKHGCRASSYVLLDAAPEKSRAAGVRQTTRTWANHQPTGERRPAAPVSPPAATEAVPSPGPMCPPAPPEASAPARCSNVHALLDQIELPCYQESPREEEEEEREAAWEEEADEAGEEGPPEPEKEASPEEAARRRRLAELRRQLAELNWQANDTYLLMRSSTDPTRREEHKQQLQSIYAQRIKIHALINRL
jgi:hypothetical protein